MIRKLFCLYCWHKVIGVVNTLKQEEPPVPSIEKKFAPVSIKMFKHLIFY